MNGNHCSVMEMKNLPFAVSMRYCVALHMMLVFSVVQENFRTALDSLCLAWTISYAYLINKHTSQIRHFGAVIYN